eukprot:TRINITY_DN1164_c0_g2_i1.p1 TRINITY_DN1164_c0_g2~~TRINITY_DN1164_c0_g2_i1.p1  ORF type:complete len:344 (+),score=61.68 TRINITY_DN1164_c0_g2_i1:35-1066(+)
MKIKVNVEWYSKQFSIDVLPSDTVWALKWKIYENEGIRKYCKSHLYPAPDDHVLRDENRGVKLDDCERSLESYSIHEGSELSCEKRDLYLSFNALLNGFRKKKSHLPLAGFTPFSLVKHGSMHMHEVRSIQWQLGRRNQFDHIESLIHCVCHSIQSLKELNLCNNNGRIGDKGCIQIAEILEANTSLKMIDLSYCEIGTPGAIRIGQMLDRNSSLMNLILQGNPRIGDDGCIRIAQALETNTSMKKLNLRHCGIGTVGTESISQMLEKNSCLEILDLSYNSRIGDEGCIRVAQALEINTSIVGLHLSDCGSVHILNEIESLLMKNRYGENMQNGDSHAGKEEK